MNRTNLFFNTEIISDQNSYLESFAYNCFYPVRYLFQGRTIEILEGQVEDEYASCPHRQWNWKKTAFTIIALIPGILLGLPAKLLSYCYASARENYQIVQSYQPASSPMMGKKELVADEEEVEMEDQPEEDSQLPEVCNMNLIYNSDPEGFSYSLPRPILESFLSGKAFDHKEEYTPEELKFLEKDIGTIYQTMLDEKPIQQPLAIMTAGAPGAGKTTLLKQDRKAQLEKGQTIAYICPDDICLQQMNETYQKDIKEKMADLLDEEVQKEFRLESYNKWRPGSNAATHLILANLIRQQYAFYFGTTSTGPATGKFLEFLKAKGYTIKLLHITAPDDIRWASIQERDKIFVQTTEKDIKEKGDLLPQRIMDAFLKFADEIEFFYRSGVKEDAVLTAKWTRTGDSSQILGKLDILDEERYDQIKKVHNAVCDKLKKPDLVWEETVEKHSIAH